MSKKVLVTGGTKGIGRAIAEIFAENGYDIILTYAADQEAAYSCEYDIRRRYGVNVSSIKADSTSRMSIDKIAEYLDKNAISLNTLVFNAAITLRTSFETTTLED